MTHTRLTSLYGAGWFTIAFGLALALAGVPVLGEPADRFYSFAVDLSFGGGMPADAEFPLAVVGAVMVGMGALLLVAIHRLGRSDPALLRRMVLIGMTAWYVTDQLASLRAGAHGNMITNTPYYLWFVASVAGRLSTDATTLTTSPDDRAVRQAPGQLTLDGRSGR